MATTNITTNGMRISTMVFICEQCSWPLPVEIYSYTRENGQLSLVIDKCENCQERCTEKPDKNVQIK